MSRATTGTGILNLMRASKDGALAFAARRFLNSRFGRIGAVSELSLDTAAQSLRLSLDLAGEPEPIEIQVNRYALDRSDDGMTLTVLDATTSRPWLTEALHEFAIGQRFVIPSSAAVLFRLLGDPGGHLDVASPR